MGKPPEFGDLTAIAKRDDEKDYYKHKLSHVVRQTLLGLEVCISKRGCGVCDLEVISIMKDEEGDEVLVWESGYCLTHVVFLTTITGDSYFVFEEEV